VFVCRKTVAFQCSLDVTDAGITPSGGITFNQVDTFGYQGGDCCGDENVTKAKAAIVGADGYGLYETQ